MAGGLVGLLDDIAALAKLAAASIDDVGVAAGRASAKAAGVVVDDMAVTPAYVKGLAADRELPIIRRIATGSLKNKLLIILPIVLVLSEFLPTLVEIILMCGGTYLCYEGAHKIWHAIKGDDHDHDVPVAMKGPEAEEATISGAIRTDFILSAEIMVLSLKEVMSNGDGFITRSIIMVVVALIITVVVYGAVAMIVKMDDVGLSLAGRDSEAAQKVGRGLVNGMPILMKWLSIIGTAAMLWVGGHILLVGAKELGWKWPYNVVHDIAHTLHDLPASAVFEWLANTAMSAVVGLVVGGLVVAIVTMVKGDSHDEHAPAPAVAGH